MKQILPFLFLFLLVSCSTTSILHTATITPQAIFTRTASVVPSPTEGMPHTKLPASTSVPTSTIETATAAIIPCDPKVEAFCITDGHFILQRPIKLPANNSVDPTYPYGSTARGTRDPHHGVEFQSPFGTPVHAADEGVVLFAGPDEQAIYSPWPNFYGNLVVIQHHDDLFTLYAHLSKIDIENGSAIKAGDKIGEVGQSGAATGSHLHFEVRRGDVEDYFSSVNPELWLAPTKNENGGIVVSVFDQNEGFRSAELTVSYYLDRSHPPVVSHYLLTYSRDLSTGEENAAVTDLAPGSYRIALTMNGKVYERWVDVKSGRLTQVVFVVK